MHPGLKFSFPHFSFHAAQKGQAEGNRVEDIMSQAEMKRMKTNTGFPIPSPPSTYPVHPDPTEGPFL